MTEVYWLLEIRADRNEIRDYEENITRIVGKPYDEEGYWLASNEQDYGWGFEASEVDAGRAAFVALREAFGSRTGWRVTFQEYSYVV